jgi:hypothetical protein
MMKSNEAHTILRSLMNARHYTLKYQGQPATPSVTPGAWRIFSKINDGESVIVYAPNSLYEGSEADFEEIES